MHTRYILMINFYMKPFDICSNIFIMACIQRCNLQKVAEYAEFGDIGTRSRGSVLLGHYDINFRSKNMRLKGRDKRFPLKKSMEI